MRSRPFPSRDEELATGDAVSVVCVTFSVVCE
jgi:hypothetical protein